MDNKENDIPGRLHVGLPGIMATVTLPLPPNFLHNTHGGTIPLSDLHPEDATLVGLAMARQLVRHWRTRAVQAAALSTDEAAYFDHAKLLHPGILQRIARDVAQHNGNAWASMPSAVQADCIALVRVTLEKFLEEMTRV